MKRPIIACAGGKSGGHIIPCLTVAQQQFPKHDIMYFSTNTPLDHSIISTQSQVKYHIPLQFGSKNYANIFGKVRMLMQALKALLFSFFALIRTRPERVISSGGAMSVPVCIAAWVLRIPIHLYELNAVPGKAITFLAPFATKVFFCFPETHKYFSKNKSCLVNYPVRFSTIDKAQTAAQARAQLHLQPNLTTIMILGGSQGSTFLNKIIMEWLQEHPEVYPKIQIIHQTGAAEIKHWQDEYKKIHVIAHVFDYHSNMALYYQAADFVICRAGAGTLFELIFFNKPFIVIPLETTTTAHQKDNAIALQIMYPHLATVISQRNVETDRGLIHSLLHQQLNNTFC